MKNGHAKISKKEWYLNGGFANSRCWRRQNKNGSWNYYYRDM